MNSPLLPYITGVIGIALTIYTIWVYKLLKRRALAVQEAKYDAQNVDSISPNDLGEGLEDEERDGDDNNEDGPDTEQQMRDMIAAANNIQATGLIYNRAVVLYNQLLSTYPTAFFAYMFGFEKADLYDTTTTLGLEESES